jgi:hypothetical protein
VSDRDLNPWRLTVVALLGALVLEVVLVFSIGASDAFAVRQLPNHLAAVLVGTFVGWVYELFRELQGAARASLRELSSLSASVETLTNKINYQDRALAMLTSCPRHNDALAALIKASMSDNFRNIPLVGVPDYLGFLEKAIRHSDGYHGVQRRPLRWYKDREAGSYLRDLRERRMKYKIRIVVLDDDDVSRMEEDLRDQDLLDYYWRHTGEVETYWLSSRDFEEYFPGTPVPRDFALYDSSLLIAYDEVRQILSFDVLGDGSPELRIFEIQRQLTLRNSSVLRRVPSLAASATEIE